MSRKRGRKIASIAYSVVTEESAREGDVADHGWWQPGGWEYSLENNREAVLAEAQAGLYDLELRDGLKHALELGCCEGQDNGDGSLSVRSVDPPNDRAFFELGESREFTLFIETTPLKASWVKSYLTEQGVTWY